MQELEDSSAQPAILHPIAGRNHKKPRKIGETFTDVSYPNQFSAMAGLAKHSGKKVEWHILE